LKAAQCAGAFTVAAFFDLPKFSIGAMKMKIIKGKLLYALGAAWIVSLVLIRVSQ
jgi:hypothetical protein